MLAAAAIALVAMVDRGAGRTEKNSKAFAVLEPIEDQRIIIFISWSLFIRWTRLFEFVKNVMQMCAWLLGVRHERSKRRLR